MRSEYLVHEVLVLVLYLDGLHAAEDEADGEGEGDGEAFPPARLHLHSYFPGWVGLRY
jgi:hypothetical protein